MTQANEQEATLPRDATRVNLISMKENFEDDRRFIAIAPRDALLYLERNLGVRFNRDVVALDGIL